MDWLEYNKTKWKSSKSSTIEAVGSSVLNPELCLQMRIKKKKKKEKQSIFTMYD